MSPVSPGFVMCFRGQGEEGGGDAGRAAGGPHVLFQKTGDAHGRIDGRVLLQPFNGVIEEFQLVVNKPKPCLSHFRMVLGALS